MNRHPSSFQLEALFVGEGDASVESHVQTCLQCRRALEALGQTRASFLTAEPASAFLARPAIQAALAGVGDEDAVASNRGAPVRPPLWSSHRLQVGVLVAMAAAVSAVFLVPTAERDDARAVATDSPPTASADRADELRFKGATAQLVVIRKRGADVTKHFGQVAIRTGDRLQVELTVSGAQRLSVGILNEDGTWLPLQADKTFAAGRHPIGAHALEVDDQPSAGWFVVGAPEAVARTRAAGEPQGRVLACKIHVEDGS